MPTSIGGPTPGGGDGLPGIQSFGGSVRTPIVGAMQTMWANFSTQRDLELFKRNIYPGNGIGVAQFLGGDLDDGWATMSTIDISEIDSKKFGYMDRLSGSSWSGLIDQSSKIGEIDASSVLEKATEGNKLVDSSKALGTTKFIGMGLAAVGVAAAPSPASFMLGAGLIKSMSGRGGAGIMKTLGLVSDLDDDIYDEVSFRAQTYMRSVWDMFQMCARLLPNYIVAVRPFEDRSTIFYGKPHWLYTSGVMPISTGFPSEEQAKNNNITIPGYISPDDELSRILYKMNKELAPSSDAIAALQAKESILSESLATMSKEMLSTTGIFRPGRSLRNKIIDFKDKARNVYYAPKNEDPSKYAPISRLPVNRGRVQVGFHLPFHSGGKGVQSLIQTGSSEPELNHKQIPQLPIRYSYPFFTNRTSGTLPSLNFNRIFKKDDFKDIEKNMNNIFNISKMEKQLISQKEGQESTALVSKKSDDSEETLDFNFDFASKIRLSGLDSVLIGTAAFDPSGIYDPQGPIGEFNASQTIQMPLPIGSMGDLSYSGLNSGTSVTLEFSEKFKTYYQDLDPAYGLIGEYFNTLELNFWEWGMPKSADDEQFYIAMRWPYNPIEARAKLGYDNNPSPTVQDEVLKKFLKMYNLNQADLVGTPDDYKKRKVLVYNPEKRVAVVCTPAYFLWGEQEVDNSSGIAAIVSPDAAYFLHLLVDDKGRIVSPEEKISDNYSSQEMQWKEIAMVEKKLTECMFTFVPDDTPVGVVTSNYIPANRFKPNDSSIFDDDTYLVGFGAFKSRNGDALPEVLTAQAGYPENVYTLSVDGTNQLATTADRAERVVQKGIIASKYYTYASDLLAEKTMADWQREWSRGGNWVTSGGSSGYFEYIAQSKVSELSQDALFSRLEEDKKNETRDEFLSVYDPLDNVSVVARGFYDERFDNTVKVIAGGGRNVLEAQQIWDQFRFGYHNYESVKSIFKKTYGLDPDSDIESDDPIFQLLTGKSDFVFEEFGADKTGLEFNTLLGADWISQNRPPDIVGNQPISPTSAIDVSIEEYIDGGVDGFDEEKNPIVNKDKGIIDIYNYLVQKRLDGLTSLVKNHFETYKYSSDQLPSNDTTVPIGSGIISEKDSQQQALDLLKGIKTPKQLYLLLVGIFRQKLWSDPYARAWLVLRPDKKRFSATGASAVAQTMNPVAFAFDTYGNENDQWSFRPVDKIFAEFINYDREYAANDNAFIKLLRDNAKAGNNAGNWVTGVLEDVNNFWDKNIVPILNAFDAALGNLLNMFRLSMAQMGYGLSELENFTKQANILNKAYNDSIYYSLGRPGTLLRAVDNPFTREYGEPVVEIREPFQRMHYISSFTHILSNNIKENFNGVATQITAVSDGKFPVTVSLDKSAPAEKQVEKTVETGLYFDNHIGEGVFGLLHPIFHPLETARGIAKHAQGEPDELTARRVALSYLKESLKDIYGGEIIIIGSTDIRVHDLVYLADTYNRMYGIFEVEQVVHHFTPETGFITSITPNALVTINDPARWFMTSWFSSWMSTQNLRNDTRLLLANKSNNSRLTVNGDVAIENLAAMLKDQMVGGMQYTHGHSALLKDIHANHLADSMPDTSDKMKQLISNSTGKKSGAAGMAIFSGIVMPAVTLGAAAAVSFIGTPIAGAAVASTLAAATTAIGAGATKVGWSAWRWVRDNVLDQHGCYIQYLNKSGQPMDAGLGSFQGMVVGKHHSVKLLPGILGVRSKTKTVDGHAFIRTDDLLKGMGWRENEISDVVRYISLENAIVHAELLKYSGLGPEKTGLNQSFKTIVTVTHVVDGDTIDVKDVLSPDIPDYRIRFDGMQASELPKLPVYPGKVAVINPNSEGAKALKVTSDALVGKVFVLRFNPSDSSMILTPDDVEAGSALNRPYINGKPNYAIARKAESQKDGSDRFMASVFYRTDSERKNSIIARVRKIFLEIPQGTSDRVEYAKSKVKELISLGSTIEVRFETILSAVLTEQAKINGNIYFDLTDPADPLISLSEDEKEMYDALVGILILQEVYSTASEWPYVHWDEYYPDGSPVTLNWELVTIGLARVYTETLNFIKGPALITTNKAYSIGEVK